MKYNKKVILSTIAFATVIGLQSFILHQQNQSNQIVQVEVAKLQSQVDQTSKTNQELLQKVEKLEKLESNLELRPRSLLSMN